MNLLKSLLILTVCGLCLAENEISCSNKQKYHLLDPDNTSVVVRCLCVNYALVVHGCQNGEHFDTVSKSCKDPAEAKCAQYYPGDTFNCTAEGQFYDRDNTCSRVYQCGACERYTKVFVMCESGLAFDTVSETCKLQKEAQLPS